MRVNIGSNTDTKINIQNISLPFPISLSLIVHLRMLRRHPTQITLTSEDIATYDDTRLQRAARLNRQENVNPINSTTQGNPTKSGDGKVDPNDELKPLPGARGARDLAREREQRIMGR